MIYSNDNLNKKNETKLFELFKLSFELNNFNYANKSLSLLLRMNLSIRLLYDLLVYIDFIYNNDLLKQLELLIIKEQNIELLKYFLFTLIKQNFINQSFNHLEFYIHQFPYKDDDQLQSLFKLLNAKINTKQEAIIND